MPPPRDDSPRTPETKNAPSGFAEVLKSFGTGRQKVSISGPSSTGATTNNSSIPILSRTRSGGGALGDGGRLSLAQMNDIHEGTANIDRLLQQLQKRQPLSERLAAAQEARLLVQGYPPELAARIWGAAKDLINIGSSLDSRETGFELLLACVQHGGLTGVERKDLFEILTTPADPEDFHFQLRALEQLSKEGRDLKPFEAALFSMLPKWLDDCHQASMTARVNYKKERSSRPNGPLREEAVLHQLFRFIIAAIKSTPKAIQKQHLVELLQQTSAICRKTTSEADVENSINVLDAVTTSSYIPMEVLDTCVEVLCTIYGTVTSLAEPTWNALSSLLKSSIGGETVAVILDILTTPPEQHGRTGNTVRGALYVLKNIICSNGAEDLPVLPFATIVDALRKSLNTDSARVDGVVIQVLSCLFDSEETITIALEEEWSDLLELLLLSFRREVDKDTGTPRPDSGTSSIQSPSTKINKDGTGPSQGLFRIINSLEYIWSRLNSHQKQVVARFFMTFHGRLTGKCAEILINHYADEQLCYNTNADCLDNLDDLIKCFILNRTWVPAARSLIIKTVQDCLESLSLKYSQDVLSPYLEGMIRFVSSEKDILVLDSLSEFNLQVAAMPDDKLFDFVISALRKCAFREDHASVSPVRNSKSLVSLSSSVASAETLPPQSPANTAVKTLVRILLRSLHTSALRVQKVFEVMLDVARSATCESDARLTVMKLLFRLRCDSNHSVLVISTSESQEMAASLCRTVETGSGAGTNEETSRERTARNDELNTARLGRSTSTNQPQGLLTRSNTRSTSGPGRSMKLTPPLWMYPGPKGLPEDPPTEASPLLCSIRDGTATPESDVSVPKGRTVLKLNVWLEVVISILQQGGDWEIYSYVLVHLGAQLANPSLFKGAIPQIKLLRNVLCEQIQATTFHDPPAASGLKKADVAICILHCITMLLSYHEHFARSEEDEIVRTFNSGLGSSDRTSKVCVNALLMCCHEMPLSVTRSLNAILQKMSQIITQSRVAMHILEFLGGLSRLPDVYVNLREDELRTVFGICARYLQYSREERQKTPTAPSTRTSYTSSRSSGTPRDIASVTESDHNQTVPSDLPQYVYSLAYHVMTFWFLSLKLPDRRKYVGWITKNLVWTDDTGVEIIEEQSQVTIDMMQRTAFSDLGETAPNPSFAPSSDAVTLKKSWLVGMSIITVETVLASGLSQITKRQAVSQSVARLYVGSVFCVLTYPQSGTTHIIYQQQTAALPPHHARSPTSTGFDPEDATPPVNVFPSHILLQLTSTVAPNPLSTQPIPLPEDDATRRAISTFDRNDTVDGHKVGVIYLGEGQTKEAEILANVEGSKDYNDFLSGLGTKVALKGAGFNTQGLDRSSDTDGEFTYAWRDRVTELVFYVATMMPTNLAQDPQCVHKKKHIGNAFVNVIFNHSNQPFHFDTFPSQFNYVNIVITPEARIAPSADDHTSTASPEDTYYKVHTLSRADFPSISPAADAKVLSAKALPAFVRLLALNASVFSLVWRSRDDGGGEHVSSWRNRLREIVKLREKYGFGAGQGPGGGGGGGGRESGRKTSGIAFAEGAAGHRGSMVNVDAGNGGESAVEGLDFSRWTL